MPPSPDPSEPSTPRTASVGAGSTVKFGAEVLGVLFAFLTGVMTARNLGPDGKGTLATMGYLMVLAAAAAGLGLGEAGVALSSSGAYDRHRVSRATAGILSASIPTAAAAFVVLAVLLFSNELNHPTGAIAAAVATLPFVTLSGVLGALLDGQHRFLFTSVVRVVMAGSTAVMTWVLVLVLGQGLTGALLAGLVGFGLAVVLQVIGLLRAGVSLRPVIDRPYVRPALRIGVPVQFSYLLMVVSSRIDLLLVHGLRGDVLAGQYSVALTLGALGTYAPFSLSTASYPRLAALAEEDVAAYIARLCRMAVAATAIGGLILVPILPVVTPRAFGPGFRASVVPTLILLLAGVFWSAQWVLARSEAARGDGGPLVRSFGLSVASMIGLDLVLVPHFGIVGAALGSVLSSAAGAGLAVAHFRRKYPHAHGSALLPRAGDVRELLSQVRQLASRGAAPRSGR